MFWNSFYEVYFFMQKKSHFVVEMAYFQQSIQTANCNTFKRVWHFKKHIKQLGTLLGFGCSKSPISIKSTTEKQKICSKLIIKTPTVADRHQLIPLWCFCWLWACKCLILMTLHISQGTFTFSQLITDTLEQNSVNWTKVLVNICSWLPYT